MLSSTNQADIRKDVWKTFTAKQAVEEPEISGKPEYFETKSLCSNSSSENASSDKGKQNKQILDLSPVIILSGSSIHSRKQQTMSQSPLKPEDLAERSGPILAYDKTCEEAQQAEIIGSQIENLQTLSDPTLTSDCTTSPASDTERQQNAATNSARSVRQEVFREELPNSYVKEKGSDIQEEQSSKQRQAKQINQPSILTPSRPLSNLPARLRTFGHVKSQRLTNPKGAPDTPQCQAKASLKKPQSFDFGGDMGPAKKKQCISSPLERRGTHMLTNLLVF